MSKETRIFDEYFGSGQKPTAKTIRPGATMNFGNDSRYLVYDRKTGQRVNNPGKRPLIITPDGHIKTQ
jgi:hypothetical protein